MHPEKYSLTWNAYLDHLRDMMKNMMNDDLTDVTLVCEDKKHIRAHKNILSACSPVFKDIVQLDQSTKPIIYLKGIHFSEMESIMQFIYLGEATFYEGRMNKFLDIARSFEIKELCTDDTETYDDDEPSTNNHVTSNDNSEEQTMNHLIDQAPKDNVARDKSEVASANGKNNCDLTFTSLRYLKRQDIFLTVFLCVAK